MEFCVQPLRRELDAKSESKLHIFYASAQSQFSFSVRSTLIVALRQPVELVLGQQRLRIPRFGAYWVDAEHAGLAQAQAAGPWLLLRCNQALWRGMQARLRATEQSKLQPVGGLWPEARSLSRWALSLVRRARKTGSSTLSETDFATLTFALQQALTGFGPKIACCPGRTQVQKAQVFRRLMPNYFADVSVLPPKPCVNMGYSIHALPWQHVQRQHVHASLELSSVGSR